MSELKPCPFCGAMPTKLNSRYTCSTLGCVLQENTVTAKEWNTRPIEDALTARIAELEAEIDIRKDQLREAKNILIDKNLQIDSLYEEGYKLQQRIAELEGKNERFIVHSDIERQDDKWIPEVQE